MVECVFDNTKEIVEPGENNITILIGTVVHQAELDDANNLLGTKFALHVFIWTIIYNRHLLN